MTPRNPQRDFGINGRTQVRQEICRRHGFRREELTGVGRQELLTQILGRSGESLAGSGGVGEVEGCETASEPAGGEHRQRQG